MAEAETFTYETESAEVMPIIILLLPFGSSGAFLQEKAKVIRIVTRKIQVLFIFLCILEINIYPLCAFVIVLCVTSWLRNFSHKGTRSIIRHSGKTV